MLQGKVASWIPGIVYAALAFVTGLLALLLPETLNRPLPETIKEVESWTRSLHPTPASPHHPLTADTDHGRSSPVREVDDENMDDENRRASTKL